MLSLPRGYYAVAADFENAPKDQFTYKGVTYAVEEGVNLFATAPEADAAATEVPEVVLEGLDYEKFEAPVLLFSVGTHRIDNFNPTSSRYVLGEKAGVTPNLAPAQFGELPPLNPERADAERESIMYGGNAQGNIRPQSAEVKILVIDGFYNRKARLFDQRMTCTGECFVAQKNIVYIGPWGKLHNLFSASRAGHDLRREVLIQNVRFEHYDGMDFGGVFAYMSTAKATFDNLVFYDTDAVFGFTTIPRATVACPMNLECAEICIKNSYFGEMRGENGIMVNLQQAPKRAVKMTVEHSVFRNASRTGESPLHFHVANEKCALTVSNSLFEDTRGGDAAITLFEGEGAVLEGCEFKGFAAQTRTQPICVREAPASIFLQEEDFESGTEDNHVIVGTKNADFADLEACYAGCSVYRGDQHVHSACGGRSDGHFPLGEWLSRMDELGVDFVAIVDHHQMRGFFLPEWCEERFMMGSEPGTGLLEPHGCTHSSNFHYNMLVPHKYGLAMVMANFPEFEFQGDELNGQFGYPKFTRERFLELSEYIHSIGGMMVHAHPKSIMCADDPLAYYFGEHSFIETVVGNYASAYSFKSHQLWVDILARGKHVYASVGSDSHRDPANTAVATFYSKERHMRTFFPQMRAGNFTAGAVGIQMCVDGAPMGSELAYREGQILKIRVGDFFAPVLKDNTAYELRVYSDKGLVYSSLFDGKESQYLAIKAQKRAFYRVEVLDLVAHTRIAAGNPIWLDKQEETAE